MFLLFVACFIIYQYQREKDYKVDLLHNRLQYYNENLNWEIKNNYHKQDILIKYINNSGIDDLRVTVIDLDGDVIYDSYDLDSVPPGNHLYRKEVQEALHSGNGYDLCRTSETTGITYFYSTTLFQNYIIRTAIPCDNRIVKESLEVDSHYILFASIAAFVLILIFYQYTSRIGLSVEQLKEFSTRAERDEPIDDIVDSSPPPNDELSEIAKHIIEIYERLHETKDALYMEREKLISHLQTSREGLGVFTKNKKEILVNNLFIQYTNLISDYNLEKTDEMFNAPEFQFITDFIDKTQNRFVGKDEKRTSSSIDKDGRIFIVECIIFEDMSFEVSINDITLKEKQTQLKRQLTQNIAHELKTPVSSIQAYLETIVNNENIPSEKVRIFLERCYEQSNRLSRLLRDISVLTRMDEAVGMLEIEKVDISSIVNNIINEVSLDLENKEITVVNHLKESIQIRGNYSLIYSIFRNLMDNSIAYAGYNIQITINCFREDNTYYYFSYADTGIGVGAEHLQRLFERFYRIDKGRSRKLGGTGLGLAIVKNAVVIHGGNISAKKNQGGGLEFIFTLAKDK